MGHYDTQIEQDNEDKRKWRREQLEIRLNNAIIGMDVDDLEKLALSAENWDSVVGVIGLIKTFTKK